MSSQVLRKHAARSASPAYAPAIMDASPQAATGPPSGRACRQTTSEAVAQMGHVKSRAVGDDRQSIAAWHGEGMSVTRSVRAQAQGAMSLLTSSRHGVAAPGKYGCRVGWLGPVGR
jgi:hypothetical protein